MDFWINFRQFSVPTSIKIRPWRRSDGRDAFQIDFWTNFGGFWTNFEQFWVPKLVKIRLSTRATTTKQTDKDKEKQIETDTDRQREREADRDRHRQTERKRSRQRQTQTDRIETDTDREKEKQIETDRFSKSHFLSRSFRSMLGQVSHAPKLGFYLVGPRFLALGPFLKVHCFARSFFHRF